MERFTTHGTCSRAIEFEIENVAAAIKESRSKSKVDKIIAKKEGARIAQSIYAKPNDDAYLNITKKRNILIFL